MGLTRSKTTLIARGVRSSRRQHQEEDLIPRHVSEITVEVDDREVHLTNLQKVFWKEAKLTKGDLLRYYAHVSPLISLTTPEGPFSFWPWLWPGSSMSSQTALVL
jgi:hypothetical protein